MLTPARAFLAVRANRDATITDLQPPGPDRQVWAGRVLAGIDDTFLLQSINPYSAELRADALGPPGDRSVGVVVENRQFVVTDPPPGTRALWGPPQKDRYAPADWADVAVAQWTRLRRHSGLA